MAQMASPLAQLAAAAQGPAAQEPNGPQKGVVALLQEFVQCSRQFAAPQHRAILQWTYDQRMATAMSLEFRANVAFLLDGVPHHVAGGWQASKKSAQRDVAERALRFFVGKWGEQFMSEEMGRSSKAPEAIKGDSDMHALDEFCLHYDACGGVSPKWSHFYRGRGCTAQVEIELLGVPHKFAGAPKTSKEMAYSDVARRVLWYFQCPGFEALFSPDPHAPAVCGKRIPEPPANWACSTSETEDLRKAERKTVLMRVQNRLQRELARVLKPGQGVWEWTFEMDEKDRVWPPLYRAKATVPGLGKSFVGQWARGQRDAQVEASLLVAEYLDAGRDNVELTAVGTGTIIDDDEMVADGLMR